MRLLLGFVLFAVTVDVTAWAGELRPVTANNYVRARTDLKLKSIGSRNGFGRITHIRQPTTPERQTVVRMNRDTLYSSAVVDLSDDVSATLPDGKGRYVSLHVINQDHFSRVYLEPRTYTLTQENVGTRYAFLIWRVFVNGDDLDTRKANKIQDSFSLRGGGSEFVFPSWDQDQVDGITASLSQSVGDIVLVHRE